jgi:2'-5' RNA ligase
MPRLFVAIDPPVEVKGSLERLCEGLPNIRWSDPGQFHLTLRFIGEVAQGEFYEIGEALVHVRHAPFELALKGLGQFPPRGAPHTLWVGVDDPTGALASLRRRIERALADAGLDPERRKFTPHVTLGRFQGLPADERLASYFFRRNLFRTDRFPVSSFALYASQLRPEGSLYTLEAEYDFVTGAVERV